MNSILDEWCKELLDEVVVFGLVNFSPINSTR